MLSPKVSVIVALYNKAKDIKICLDSLINQTLKDIEIIVVNDCSSDDSLKIAKSIKDNRIKIISNEKNMGIGYTRNVGIKAAAGEYVGFVDADDYVAKDMYEKHYIFAKENNLDLLNSNYYKVYNNKKEIFKVNSFNITNIKNNPNIINLINYGPCNKLFNNQMLRDNDIKFMENTKFEDVLFIAKAINKSSTIGYLDYAGYFYQIHGGSETTSVDERTFDIFKVMNEVNKVYEFLKESKELEYLNITEITRYMLKQRYQTNKKSVKTFINEGYKYLNSVNKNWKKNELYKKEPFLKRIIKNNKTFLIIYCIIINRGV